MPDIADMKNLLCLYLLFVASIVHSQGITIEQAKGYAAALVKGDFLTPAGEERLLQEIKNNAIETEHASVTNGVVYTSKELSKESILQFCYDALAGEFAFRLSDNVRSAEKDLSSREPSARNSFTVHGFDYPSSKDYAGSISTKTSVFGYTRSKTLQTFLAAGLINDMIFKECKAVLDAKKVWNEVGLLAYMLFRGAYYSNYDFNKNEQLQYIDRLVAHGILTPEGKQVLLASYQPYEIKPLKEILKQSTRYTYVDLRAYAPKPAITYPVIFDAVKKILPAFNYKNLQVGILESNDGDLIEEKVILNFYIDSVLYSHRFFHDFRKPHGDNDEPARVDQGFEKGINKWLGEMESPYRLYTLNILDEDEMTYGSRSVGLLLLKQGEDSLISDNPYVLSQESFNKAVNRKAMAQFIHDLQQQGFFSHLTATDIKMAQDDITNSEINTLASALVQFPGIVVYFDWESDNLTNPYEALTQRIMTAARGAFKVTKIVDDFAKGEAQVKYGFTMNGKRYDTKLQYKEDWLDPDFLTLLRKAWKENKVDGDLYDCLHDGQEGGLIFMTAAQHQFIMEHYPEVLKIAEN